MTNIHQKSEEAAHEAVESTARAQEAIEKARSFQLEVSDERIAKALSSALRDVFGEKENTGRFIDTSRIPLICQDLKGIHSSLSSIENNMSWAVKIVLGAVILAILALVLKP